MSFGVRKAPFRVGVQDSTYSFTCSKGVEGSVGSRGSTCSQENSEQGRVLTMSTEGSMSLEQQGVGGGKSREQSQGM